MTDNPTPIPQVCTKCPHFDTFHSNCTHPYSQTIIHDLIGGGSGDCTVYPGARMKAMTDLEEEMKSNFKR